VTVVGQDPPEPGRERAVVIIVGNHCPVSRDAEALGEGRDAVGAKDMDGIIGVFEPLWRPDLDGVFFAHEPDGSRNMRAVIACRLTTIDDPEILIVAMFPEPVRLGEQFRAPIVA
jgi:hypothetical protein